MSGFLDTKLYSPKLPLLLRNPELNDAKAFAAILSNPANTEFDPMCSPDPIPESKALEIITAMRTSAAESIPSRVNLVIVLLPSTGADEAGQLIGLSGFGGIDEIKGKRWADAGAMINPEFRGRGYAIESMRLSIEFALEKLSVEGISCEMLQMNLSMINLVEKRFGWVGKKSEGKYGKEIRYEIGRDEWERTKERLDRRDIGSGDGDAVKA